MNPRTLARSFAAALGVALFGAIALAVPAAHAATITVDTLADGPLAQDGACTLREAILNANGDDDSGSVDCAVGDAADRIVFALAGTITLTGDAPALSDNQRTTIDGDIDGDGRADVVLDGDHTHAGLEVGSGAVVALQHLEFFECEAAFGAAIVNRGELDVLANTFSGNTAPSAGDGGAIYNGGDLSVSYSTFSDNNAARGAGIFNDPSATALEIDHSSFSGNVAGDSGGALATAGPATIVNSTFFGNQAGTTGGAIDIESGTTAILYATLADNAAGSLGGALHASTDFGTSVTLVASIVADNGSANCSGPIIDGGGNLATPTNDFSCSLPAGNPALGPFGQHGGMTATLLPGPGSAAVDLSDCIDGIDTDQRDVPRPQGSRCDAGAVEVRDDSIFAGGFDH